MLSNVSTNMDYLEELAALPAPVRAFVLPVLPMLVLWDGLSGTARCLLTFTLICLIGFFMQANLKPGRAAMRFMLNNRGWLYRDSGQNGGPKTSSNIQVSGVMRACACL